MLSVHQLNATKRETRHGRLLAHFAQFLARFWRLEFERGILRIKLKKMDKSDCFL